MTPESIRMSDLIMEAEHKCRENGHDMDWRRYNNQLADSNCRKCNAYVYIKRGAMCQLSFPIWQDVPVSASAIHTKCKGR